MANIVSVEIITSKIFFVRSKKIMLDRDLAQLYGVPTKVLNQAVKRNKERFPGDFMFQLTKTEKDELVTICDRFRTLKHATVLPYAFTQEGVAMLSGVLNSDRAIKVNIQIMRAFVKLRHILSLHKGFEIKLRELEDRLGGHDADIRDIFETIRQLMGMPQAKKVVRGFAHK